MFAARRLFDWIFFKVAGSQRHNYLAVASTRYICLMPPRHTPGFDFILAFRSNRRTSPQISRTLIIQLQSSHALPHDQAISMDHHKPWLASFVVSCLTEYLQTRQQNRTSLHYCFKTIGDDLRIFSKTDNLRAVHTVGSCLEMGGMAC